MARLNDDCSTGHAKQPGVLGHERVIQPVFELYI